MKELAVIAAFGGIGIVLWGTHIDFTEAPIGISVWDGEFRSPTEEEWAFIEKGLDPFQLPGEMISA